MARPRILIVSYSRSGNTREVATAIARVVDADLEELVPLGPSRDGLRGYMRCSLESATGTLPALAPSVHDPASYELVVVGTPTWNLGVSTPVRSWLHLHAKELRDVAFYCTCGGAGGERVLAEMGRLAGRAPRTAMILRERDLRAPRYRTEVLRFANALRPPAAAAAEPTNGGGPRAAR